MSLISDNMVLIEPFNFSNGRKALNITENKQFIGHWLVFVREDDNNEDTRGS
jgi:hypothetical protein